MSNVKNYTLQGGEKTIIGGELVISEEGKLFLGLSELEQVAFQENSSATTIAGLVIDFNALLAKLKQAGIMAIE